ncbi:MAG TPA: hypothetical protein VFE50_19490, partial [Cyclobacteriaceae bacterium]|nr:hypothetical protein [Cyclobacteriaceae bacterium]
KEGHFVDKQGNKTECFINDEDWYNSPKSISYRLTQTGNVQKIDTDQLTEFTVDGTKYFWAKVQYDQSNQDIKRLGVTSNPEWATGDLLLKTLVDGTAKLYHYHLPQLNLFFFSVSGSPIEQLVFRNYLNPGDPNQVLANRMYLSQLNSGVKCGDKAPANPQSVPYEEKALTKYFRSFNICSGDAPPEKEDRKREGFSLRITPGVDFVANEVERSGSRRVYEFSSNTNFRVGVDFQSVLPFLNGKFAIILEPHFSYYSGKLKGGTETIEYKQVTVPLGVRYRYMLSDKNYIFANAMVGTSFFLSFKHGPYEITKGMIDAAGGAGVAVGRFSLEARYSPEWRYTVDNIYRYKVDRTVLILGFKIR